MIIRDFGIDACDLGAARQMCLLLAHLYAREFDEIDRIIGTDGRFLVSVKENGTWPPSWVAYETSDGAYLVVIEGTTSVWQGVGHIYGTSGTDSPDGVTPCMGVWDGVADLILDRLKTFLPAAPSPIIVRISGHSYGAGVGHILALKLRKLYGAECTIELLTFGEPRGLASGYKGRLPSCHWRITSTSDVVPLVPYPGLMAYLPNFTIPPRWSTIAPSWQHYGTEIKFYPMGNIIPEPIVLPLAEGVNDSVPDAHYIPNYWARLLLYQKRFNGYLPSQADLKTMKVTLEKFPSIQITPELPGYLLFPPNPPVFIPSLQPQGVNLVAGPTNSMCKHTWQFHGQNGENWTECYYLTIEGEQSRASLIASLPPLPEAVVQSRLGMLYHDHVLFSITANYVVGLRQAARRTYNAAGQASSYIVGQGPELVAKAAIWDLVGIRGAHRKLWLRGLPAGALISSETSGEFDLENSYLAKCNRFFSNVAWVSALKPGIYGIMNRVPKPAGINLNPVMISTVGPGNGTAWSLVTTQMPHGLTDPNGQVIIYGAGAKDGPGLNGIYSYLIPGHSTTTFWIAFALPIGDTWNSNLGFTRQYNVNAIDPISFNLTQFFGAGIHKTRNPQTNSRGDKRPVRMRVRT